MSKPNFDNVDPKRRELMARVRAKGTRPELVVRKAAHAMGYRFRLHRRDLPGTPDLVFPRLMKVIFVHGCFWHRHGDCSRTTHPNTRVDFWQSKFAANVARDERNRADLEALGWHVGTVWECETLNAERLAEKLRSFFDEGSVFGSIRPALATSATPDGGLCRASASRWRRP